jgi:hypothetical protein
MTTDEFQRLIDQPQYRKNPLQQSEDMPLNFDFPFKSKRHYTIAPIYPKAPPDYTLKPLKKMHRPDFSLHSGTWEVDVVYAPDPMMKYESRLYLFLINNNTKYLMVYPIGSRHMDVMKGCILDMIARYRLQVTNIRGDGEFKSLNIPGVYVYSSSSPFSNHNRVIDRAIRTIRDAVGQNYYAFRDQRQVQIAVDWYNRPPHRSLQLDRHVFLTPEEVQGNLELEGLFIRRNIIKCDRAEERQFSDFLFTYRPGNVLMVHLDFAKTPFKFLKRRRNFNTLATFERYEHGNVVCKILNISREYTGEREGGEGSEGEVGEREAYDLRREIEVPIYFTKFVSSSLENLPKSYSSYFK